MADVDYKSAYERQKKARERAELNLENKSRELYEANQSLVVAYNKLKDQKSQILHQEKLASIGQLSAGVAHEINNPTGFVKSNLNSLKAYLKNVKNAFQSYDEAMMKGSSDADPRSQIGKIKEDHDVDFILTDVDSLIEESLDGLSRIENIVKSLKNFARPDQEDDELYSINECIQNTLRLLNSEVKYKAELILELNDIPDIRGKPGAMSQVILNLIVNAADAIRENGEIRISTQAEESNIRIRISDNGSGMPQSIITKIFDPFFSTKDVGKGTGLGLSVCHSIVKSHKGQMTVNSSEGLGTEFIIYLPHHTAE